MQKSANKGKKDIIFIAIFLVLLAIHLVFYIVTNGFKSVADLFTQTFLLLMSYVGMLSIFHYKGVDALVPNFILEKEEKKQKKFFNECINEMNLEEKIRNAAADSMRDSVDQVFDLENSYIRENSDERLGFILSQLGITMEQFETLQLNMVKLRCLPLKNLDDAEMKLKTYLQCQAPFVIDMNNIPSACRTYNAVRFFINFETVMYLQRGTRQELATIMGMLIREKEDTRLSAIDKIIVPYDSNLILGYEVGKILGKPVVHMRVEKGRLERDKPWDGELSPTDKAIIVHDVLVSASQIMHVFRNIPIGCDIKAVYCLVARTDTGANGLNVLKENNKDTFYILETNDVNLSKIVQ